MFENTIKQTLAASRTAWGISLPDASEFVAALSVNAGPDFLWVDLEHRPYEVDQIRWIPIICRRKNCACVVRPAGLDPQLIKKALDIGANTLMIPQVNTAEEAALAVRYAKYPPEGSRGISPLWTFFMDVSWDDYLPAANRETAIIVQIETPEGMKNLDAIAAVEGVDVVFAGPMDLSASLGHIGQPRHPKVLRFLEDFPERVRRAGKAAGVTFGDPKQCQEAWEQGFRFISCGNLLSHGDRGTREMLANFRALENGGARHAGKRER